MWVSKVNLKNIRGFENTTIQFSEGLNVLIGPNNSGKTTILNALFLLQRDTLRGGDIRINSNQGHVNISLDGSSQLYFSNTSGSVQYQYLLATGTRTVKSGSHNKNAALISSNEPTNFIYPYLSKRKVASYQESFNNKAVCSVTGNFSNLYAKIDHIVNPEKPAYNEYIMACDNILGFRVTTTASEDGKKAVYVIDDFAEIPLDKMGEGVPNLLGLIVDLCVAKNKLFLIEEPENDIHPRALKKLLELITKKSSNNQFIITTHSNIVTKYLGAHPLCQHRCRLN